MRGPIIAVIASLFASAFAPQPIGPWTADAPSDARRTDGEDRTAFVLAGRGVLIYFGAEPLNGRSLAAATEDFIEASLGDKARLSTDAKETEAAPGFEGRVVVVATDGQMRAYHARSDGEDFAVALLAVPNDIEAGHRAELMAPLARARLTAELGAAAPSPAALGAVAAGGASLDFAAATAAGIDPETTIIPGDFGCFYANRMMHPRELSAGTLTIDGSGAYVFSGDRSSGAGRYAKRPGEEDEGEYDFTGPISNWGDAVNVGTDDYGQTLRVRIDGENARCMQRGPALDDAMLRMIRAVPRESTLTCATPEGGRTTLTLTPSRYALPEGGGALSVAVENEGSGWSSDVELSGGPWDGADLKWKEHEDGRLEAGVSLYRSFRTSAFSVGSERRPLAQCVGRASPRPSATYGAAPAPKGPGGGLAGWYRRTEFGVSWLPGVNGMSMSTSTVEPGFYEFLPDGYVRPAERGADADLCRRTLPNGWPACLRYERRGGLVRIEEHPGVWEEDWYGIGEDSEAEDTFDPTAPMTGYRVDATYTHQSAMSAGGGFQDSFLGVFWNGVLRMSRDGRYSWERSQRTQMGVSGAAVGGGGGFSGDREDGTYEVIGNWLTFTASDGQQTRLFVHNWGDGWRPGDPPLDYLDLDGDQYVREGVDD